MWHIAWCIGRVRLCVWVWECIGCVCDWEGLVVWDGQAVTAHGVCVDPHPHVWILMLMRSGDPAEVSC